MAILIALIPAVAWGSIGLLSGKLGGNAYQQTLGMTIGALVFGIGTFLFLHPVLDAKTMIVGIISGLFWSVGQGQQFQSMQAMGVSKTVPMSTGMQLVVNTLAGALLFHEWKTTHDFIFGIFALVILIAGATLTSMKDPKSNLAAKEDTQLARGFRALLISTAGYGGYTIIVNWAHVGATAIVFPQAIGMFIGALVFAFFGIGKAVYSKKTVLNISTGLLWGLGNLFMLISMSDIGLAISYSLSQCGIIISTIGSIFLLGERKTKKEMVFVTIGCLLVIVGGVTLGMMK
ncbi:GRP family sugar transporter [Latilactobacillus fuchuensis]|uniref:GRP family sugar transporter n=1 Tax=Latilactobacillus fuchuensis TaxID=164393 RepID=UPI0020C7D297|nr:GRP family sugar transporter [Latilactobacillus fuchuensis]MCP8858135.1 GRP family sugar transporter [Latilactobacillus fuchuensis]